MNIYSHLSVVLAARQHNSLLDQADVIARVRLRLSALTRAGMALSMLFALGGVPPLLAAEKVNSPQGDTWDSIKQLPDWSGVWVMVQGSGAAEDSWGTDGGRVPLTPKYMELRATARANYAQANLSTCLPAGPTAVLQHGILHEYLFTPGRVTIIFEDGEVRRINTDGRAHQSLEELSGSFMGDSIGHWEGKTLIVDTIGFPNGELWQNHGVRATKHTHLVERISLNGQGEIQIDNAMTDPAIFTKPYVYIRRYKRSSLPLNESVCAQNNRDTGEGLDLTPPPETE